MLLITSRRLASRVRTLSLRTFSQYIDSYYTRSISEDKLRPRLTDNVELDVCVVGGGLAGLNTALALAERGKKVAVLEAGRVSWGASGRNGGFVHAGYSLSESGVVKRYGAENARRMYTWTLDAMSLIRKRVEEFDIPCGPLQPGMVIGWWFANQKEIEDEVRWQNDTFGTEMEFWSKKKMRTLYQTDRYHGALFDPSAFHMHSLNYALGIASACEKRGVQIFEDSEVVAGNLEGAEKVIKTKEGSVRAEQVIFCCSGYIGSFPRRLSLATMPVATYVMVTEPIPDAVHPLRAPHCVTDNRYAPDYYRPLADGRILWGGRVNTLRIPQEKLLRVMRDDMLKVYPQLSGIKAEVAWDGTMGYAIHKMPQLGQLQPGVFYNMGHGGHGMATTTMAGEIMGTVLAGAGRGDCEEARERSERMRERMTLYSDLGFSGGPAASAAAQIGYWLYELRDLVHTLRYNGRLR